MSLAERVCWSRMIDKCQTQLCRSPLLQLVAHHHRFAANLTGGRNLQDSLDDVTYVDICFSLQKQRRPSTSSSPAGECSVESLLAGKAAIVISESALISVKLSIIGGLGHDGQNGVHTIAIYTSPRIGFRREYPRYRSRYCTQATHWHKDTLDVIQVSVSSCPSRHG